MEPRGLLQEYLAEKELVYRMLTMLIKANDRKRVDRRLQVIKLHLDGMRNSDIARKTDYSRARVGQLIKEYNEQGLVEFAKHKYGGNRKSLTFAQEAAILQEFEEEMNKGKVVTAALIKKKLDEVRGKDTGRGYVYMLLKRHDFRLCVPKGTHPKKASQKDIEASKKLT